MCLYACHFLNKTVTSSAGSNEARVDNIIHTMYVNPGGQFLGGAQFSRKLARLYEYSYLGPVLYMNIHIGHDTKVFVTLREKKVVKYPFPVSSPNPNPNYNTKSKPLHHKQLRKTLHTILPNVYRAYLV